MAEMTQYVILKILLEKLPLLNTGEMDVNR